MKTHDEIMREWDAARVAISAGDTSSRPRDWLEDVLGEKDARIAKLEAALREIADLPDVDADHRSTIVRDALEKD